MKKKSLIIILSLFCFSGIANSAERDCSDPKTMSDKLFCKASNLKKPKNETNKSEKKKFGFFDKLNKWNSKNKTLTNFTIQKKND